MERGQRNLSLGADPAASSSSVCDRPWSPTGEGITFAFSAS